MDQEQPSSYIGKHLLIGITYLNADGSLQQQTQLHGEIVNISEEVISVKLPGSDELFTLPPDLDALSPAPEGEYRLHSTGEVVVNPDWLTTWTVTAPDDDDEVKETGTALSHE